MASNELVAYVHDRRAAGMSDDRIKTILHNSGYPPLEIEEALRLAGPAAQKTPAATPAQMAASTPARPAQPAAQPAPAQQPQAPAEAIPKRFLGQEDDMGDLERAHKRKIIFSAVAALLVIGGVAYGAYVYYGPPSPQKVMAMMFQSGFSNAHSMHIDLQASVSASAQTSPSPSNASLTFQASSSYDLTDVSDPAADAALSLGYQGSIDGQNLSGNLAGEFRVVSSTAYVDITSIPAELGVFVSPFVNQWISVPLTSSSASQIGSQLGVTGGIPALTDGGIGSGSSTISSSSVASIESALANSIQITKTLPGATLDGTPTYHYQYIITKPGLENLYATIETVAQIPSAQAAQNSTSFANALSAVNSMGGELWIGEKDYYPREVSFSLSFATSTPSFYGSAPVPASGTISITTMYSNINMPQNIQAPAGAESYDQILSSFQPGGAAYDSAFGETQAQGRDARRLSDLNEVQSALELYYEKCGYYPGAAEGGAPPCGPFIRTGSWSQLESSIASSNLGIPALPNDPLATSTGATYYYGTNAAGTNYIVAAKLEDASNSIFLSYKPPSLVGFKITGLSSCSAPFYCTTF